MGGRWRFGVAGAVLMLVACQLALVARPTPVEMALHIPPGTAIPVKLDETFEVSVAHAQQKIEARVAQDVPLLGKQKISLRARVVATVVSVEKSGEGPVNVSLKFDQVEEKDETMAITASVRAIASYLAVRAAQIPLAGADAGTPTGWGTTVQIGGDQRFGDGGKVRNQQKQTVGKGVIGGVLVRLTPNDALGCEGSAPGDRPQATWVFSAGACGVYGMKNLRILRNGRKDPVGVITLEFAKDDMKLEPGTSFLLRTVKP
ncbi:MAG TPA: hypothetical protein VMH31_09125 [Methylomirabilota bacterium]|nr:hypothetical protein [Methylomirabilota bacterium]